MTKTGKRLQKTEKLLDSEKKKLHSMQRVKLKIIQFSSLWSHVFLQVAVLFTPNLFASFDSQTTTMSGYDG